MEQQVDTFLFDLDDTLVQSQEAKIAAIKKMASEYKIRFNNIIRLKHDLRHSHSPWGVLIDKLQKEGSQFERNTIRKRYWRCLRQFIPSLVRSYPNIPELLSTIRTTKLKIGVVTSLPKYYASAEILAANLGMFNCLIAYHNTDRRKPYPDPINKALQQLRSTRSRTIYIGDHQIDIRAGKSAGVKTGLALWGVPNRNWQELKIEKPDHIFETPKMVLRILIR